LRAGDEDLTGICGYFAAIIANWIAAAARMASPQSAAARISLRVLTG
jgi:hypothetical protein